MVSDIAIRASIAAVRAAAQPISVNQIRGTLGKEARFPAKAAGEVAAALLALPESEAVFPWPDYRGQRNLFWNRPLGAAVRLALLAALEQAPMTAARAAAALAGRVPKLGAARRVEESRAQLRILAASQEVLAVDRLYFSPAYLRRLLGPDTRGADVGRRVLEAVRQLESGPGNYVSIPKLRAAPGVRALVDEAVIALADRGELVLALYDGPTPVPEDRELDFVRDAAGALFVAVALPRHGEPGQ